MPPAPGYAAPPAVPEAEAAPEPISQFQPVEGYEDMLDMPLGTLIFRAGLIAPQQLEDALAEGLRTGKRLGEVLLSRGWLTELDLGRLLAGQKGLPFLDISTVAIDPNVSRRVPIEECRRLNALPLLEEFGVPIVALADPHEDTMETMRRLLGTHVRFVVAPPSILSQRIEMSAGGAPEPAAAPPPPVAADPSLFEQTAPPAAVPAPPAPAYEAPPAAPVPAPEAYEPPAPSWAGEVATAAASAQPDLSAAVPAPAPPAEPTGPPAWEAPPAPAPESAPPVADTSGPPAWTDTPAYEPPAATEETPVAPPPLADPFFQDSGTAQPADELPADAPSPLDQPVAAEPAAPVAEPVPPAEPAPPAAEAAPWDAAP
ncbi:MAG: hypothetical protein ACJ8DJ_10130, partial [Gemmatimonadales bacterium]